jgi:hypothetical protein
MGACEFDEGLQTSAAGVEELMTLEVSTPALLFQAISLLFLFIRS